MTEMVGTGKLAIQIKGPAKIAPVLRPEAQSLKGQVQVKVEAVGICGSDLALWSGQHPYATYPIVPGHEIGGRIAADPEGQFEPGALVAVRPTLPCFNCPTCARGEEDRCPEVRVMGIHMDGGMAETIRVEPSQIVTLPAYLTADAAAMVEPSAVAHHMLERAGLEPGMSLAVIGTGSVGNLAILLARLQGAAAILALDILPSRLAFAESAGADHIVDGSRPGSSDRALASLPGGYDASIDLVGQPSTWSLAADLTRPGGTIVFGALPRQPQDLDLEVFYRKELTLRTSRLYGHSFAQAAKWIAEGRFDPTGMISHRIPLRRAHEAFLLAADQPGECLKILLVDDERSSSLDIQKGNQP
jgi:2-desacetyl-2-hydroxyethyl bacteriochlorophyllide A dehydrogenase